MFLERYGRETHAESSREILAIFDRFGIEYVLVEKRKDFRAPRIHQILRNLLKNWPFEQVKEIPILSNHLRMEREAIRIYRYLHCKPLTADHIEIRLPWSEKQSEHR